MSGEELNRLRIELNFFKRANVYAGEVGLVESALQYFPVYKDALFFQFLLRSEHVPSGVYLSCLGR